MAGLLALWSTGMLASLGRCLRLVGPLDGDSVTQPLIVSGRECTVVGTRIGAYPAVRDAMSFLAKVRNLPDCRVSICIHAVTFWIISLVLTQMDFFMVFFLRPTPG